MFNFNNYKNVTAGYVLIQSVWKAFKIRGIKMSNTCTFMNTHYKTNQLTVENYSKLSYYFMQVFLGYIRVQTEDFNMQER